MVGPLAPYGRLLAALAFLGRKNRPEPVESSDPALLSRPPSWEAVTPRELL